MNRSLPYNTLPMLPPGSKLWEDIDIYKALADAKASLGELKGRASIIPEQRMLINTLVLQEAKESSSIENIFTTNDKLYKAFASPNSTIDPNTKEVLRYKDALWKAWKRVSRSGISIPVIEEIFQTVKHTTEGVRGVEVYIGNSSVRLYTPPKGYFLIRNKLTNLIEYLNKADKTDPLIKMSIAHYQFEAIHPFIDGNGRTGRIINVLYLSKAGILELPILYLSQYINENKNDYYRLLQDVTENQNWKGWILYMLSAVKETSDRTLFKINSIYSLFEETIKVVRKKLPKIYKYEIVELLFSQVYCKVSFLTKMGISRNTAGKYLNALVKIGVLEKIESGKENIYQNVKLFKLLSSK